MKIASYPLERLLPNQSVPLLNHWNSFGNRLHQIFWHFPCDFSMLRFSTKIHLILSVLFDSCDSPIVLENFQMLELEDKFNSKVEDGITESPLSIITTEFPRFEFGFQQELRTNVPPYIMHTCLRHYVANAHTQTAVFFHVIFNTHD